MNIKLVCCRDVNSREISFLGLEAQSTNPRICSSLDLDHCYISLLSIGNQYIQGLSPTGGFADLATGSNSAGAATRRRATTLAAASPAPSRAAGLAQLHGRVAGEALWWWVVSRGEGALTVVVHRGAAGSSFNDSPAAAAVWVVAGRCTGSAKSIVNGDASSLLYRPAEDHHLYTTRPDVLCRLIAGFMLCHALWYADQQHG